MTPIYKFVCLISLAVLACAGAEKHQDDPWKKAGSDQGLRQAFERAVYEIAVSGDGTYQGANPAQRLDLEFSAREAWLKTSDPRANVGFTLTGYGYGQRLLPPAPAKLAGTGSRVEYQRGGITEWYQNEPRGLEQGFTLAQRPGTASAREPLVIALGVSGELRPVMAAAGDAVLLQAAKHTVLRYAGLQARDARGREVPSWLEVGKHEIRLVIEDSGAEYPLAVDPVVTWNQESELTASDGANGDLFGWSVSVSGNTAVVGAYNKTVNSNSAQGAAYVFVQSAGTWTQQAKLIASDGAANDNFGYSVSVSGNTAVVGAYSKTVNSNSSQGAAYVFVQSGGIWTQQAELTASDGAATDNFGASVSLSGATAVVGAYNKTINSNSAQGVAYVFVQSGRTWSQQAELIASDGVRGDLFGFAVSVSGPTAVVGSYAHTVNSNLDQGAAYVFVQSAGIWSQQVELSASDGAGGDQFGSSVSVSGATAVVGAHAKTVGSNVDQGAAYVFVQSGATWSQQAKLTASDGVARDFFGWSVSVNGATAVVGAYTKTVGSNVDQGAAYVFVQSAGIWSQQAELTASDGKAGDAFGSSVSVSGSTALEGAYQKWVNSDPQQGVAYMFAELPSTTMLSASPNPALFGSAVTLTATVSPSPASGTVTFYDGTTVLGVAPVSNSVGTFTTTLLASGVGSLTARYEGGGSAAYASSLSAPYAETVNAQIADGFIAASGSPFAAGNNPSPMAVADFNGDGISDLAVASPAFGTITVLLGNGSGGFTVANGSPFVEGNAPNSLAVGDFNGDGNADLAVGNINDGTVAVLLGDGSGGFTAASGSPFAIGGPAWSLAVGDFNGDGIADLAVALPESPAGKLVVLLGNGIGGFVAVSGSPFPDGVDGEFVAVGDFNGDGAPDLAVSNNTSNTVTVLLGNGGGDFTAASGSPFAVGTLPLPVVVGDFNGDGNADLAVGDLGDSTVTILLGDGSGGFIAANGSPVAAGAVPTSVAVGDFNGDGREDLAVVNESSNTVTLLLGNGSGGFAPQSGSPFAVGNVPASVAVADFNGDGKTDLVIANYGGNNLTVLLGADLATQLQIAQQPSSGTVGSPIGNVVVQVEDASGNPLSGSTAAVTIASSPAGVGGTLTVNAVGGAAAFSNLVFSAANSYTLTASSTGLTSATSASIQITQATQTITFGALSNEIYGTAPFTVSAIASSGLPVSFASLTTSVCTVSGATVTLVATGTCTIQATQAGNATYSAAQPVNQSFQVTQGIQSQTITFGPLSNESLGTAPFTLSATASSGLVVSFASTTPAVCTVSGATVTLIAPGVCTIQATQPGNADYTAAMPVTQSFEVTYQGLGTNSLLVGSAGGASSVIVTYAGAWAATANASFLHIAAGSASGTGNRLVVFTYDPFSGTGIRTGTLTIAGFTVTVTQAGTNYITVGPVVLGAAELPEGLAVDSSGNVYIAGSTSIAGSATGVIYKWTAATQEMALLVSSGLSAPYGLAADGYGNLYIADEGTNAIYEWSASTQQLTTLVSTGLSSPAGLALDGSGNLYIADAYNNAIKEWSAATQQVTTVVPAGTLDEPTGVAADSAGNVYIADFHAIWEWNASTQQLSTLVSAGLNQPTGVAVDGSGNIYIADYSNFAVKEWSPATQQVTTLSSGLKFYPYGVAVDGSGNLYFANGFEINEIQNAFVGPASLTEPASAGSDSLLPVLPSTTSLTGIFAPTSDQSWLTIGTIAAGIVNFSFTANTSGSSRTAHITVLGQQITVTQNGVMSQTITFGALPNQAYGAAPFTVSAKASSELPVSFASLTTPVCTVSGAMVTLVGLGQCTIQATQAGNATYSAATPVNQSLQVTQAGQTITFTALWNQPLGSAPFVVTATASSGLAVSFASTTPAVCTVSGTTVTLVALGVCTVQATQPGNAEYTAALPVNQSFEVLFQGVGTNSLLVGSAGGSSSVVLSYSGAWTASANASFLHIATGSSSGTGNAVVMFTYDVFSGTGTRTGTLTIAGSTVTVTQAGANYIGPGPVTTVVSSGLNYPFAVAVDGSGNVYIADSGNNAIKEWSPSTQQVTTLVSSGLNQPRGVAVDGFGNVYIADFGNNAIEEWIPSTQHMTTLVSSGLNGPLGVAVDGSGNVYIADYGNNAIKEWSALTQQVTTLVSSGLSSPYGLAVDGSGNVYIADTFDEAVKEWVISTQQLTTLVSSGLDSPAAVAVDGSGNVYIADADNNAIKEWSSATQQVTVLVSSPDIGSGAGIGINKPQGVAVDGSGNVYFADTYNFAIREIPNAFVGPASLTEPASVGSDSLLPVLPPTTSLTGIFAPTSDQSWLTIGTVATGVVNFSFTANTSGSSRTAHITVLGQQITVTQNAVMSQSITFGALPNQVYGTAPFTVSATASSGLPVSFVSLTTSVCTVSGAMVTLVATGTCTIQATQAGNANYSAATPVNQSFQVTQGMPTVSFTGSPASASYEATFTVTATTNASTTAVITASGACSVAGAVVTITAPSGTCLLTATWAADNNYQAATATQSTIATKATPTITWATPTVITHGTALSGAQLDAAATYNGATVAGTFVYTPAKGTVLDGGSQILSVSFTPNKTADYNGATASVTLQVNQATPKITWAKPAAITYGTALSSTQLDATASVPGNFVYTPPAGASLSAGAQTLSVTFTPTDAIDYSTATDTVTITVDKAAPTLTWATPAPITYGTAVGVTQLDATASVPGTFVYSPAAGATPAGGSDTLKVTFTPTDTTDYMTATASVTLKVNAATPTITWSTTATTYGTGLSGTQLDAKATYNGSIVAGTLVYTPAKGTVLGAGSQTLSVTFTPNNTGNYNGATASVTLQVNQATPKIRWAKPAAITYGTALSSAQLDATSAVPGSFTYSPPSGTVLSAGTQTLSVTFTPTDTADYTTATDSVSITVKP